ncbi:MAG: hypothetical protein IJM95_08545, partial [Anaerotignum sp.]|nr:hypothetical protein [Anaerotignum sp.]
FILDSSVRKIVVYSIIREKWEKGKALADFSESLVFIFLREALPHTPQGELVKASSFGRRLRRRLNLGGAHIPLTPI